MLLVDQSCSKCCASGWHPWSLGKLADLLGPAVLLLSLPNRHWCSGYSIQCTSSSRKIPSLKGTWGLLVQD